MKKFLTLLAVVCSLGMAAVDVEAAKRFGGGSNIGKQRAAPTQKEATPAPASPNQAAPASPAGAPAGAAAAAGKPSFMSRWGGLLAGLGIGALLASMFGAQMGPIVGMLLMGLLVAGAIFLVMRMLAAKKVAAPTEPRAQFAGIGSALPESRATELPRSQAAPASSPGTLAPTVPADFEAAPFLRVAKSSFIRLQAANDAGDLDDIRDYTTPEMFAEISLQVSERGGVAQKTEVVSVEAQLVEVVTEGGYDIASVRFYGLLREAPGANPEPFDETWHVRRKAGDRKDSWLIAGIQQNP
ncbi:MAG: TIM44-like domain-containing protein [Usitatibacter sp.]